MATCVVVLPWPCLRKKPTKEGAFKAINCHWSGLISVPLTHANTANLHCQIPKLQSQPRLLPTPCSSSITFHHSSSLTLWADPSILQKFGEGPFDLVLQSDVVRNTVMHLCLLTHTCANYVLILMLTFFGHRRDKELTKVGFWQKKKSLDLSTET